MCSPRTGIHHCLVYLIAPTSLFPTRSGESSRILRIAMPSTSTHSILHEHSNLSMLWIPQLPPFTPHQRRKRQGQVLFRIQALQRRPRSSTHGYHSYRSQGTLRIPLTQNRRMQAEIQVLVEIQVPAGTRAPAEIQVRVGIQARVGIQVRVGIQARVEIRALVETQVLVEIQVHQADTAISQRRSYSEEENL